MKSITSKSQHYAYINEGVGYVRDILNKRKDRLADIVAELSKEGVLGGEDGQQWVKGINEVSTNIDTLIGKFNQIAEKIDEVCAINGGQVSGSMTEDAETAKNKLQSLTSEIADSLKK